MEGYTQLKYCTLFFVIMDAVYNHVSARGRRRPRQSTPRLSETAGLLKRIEQQQAQIAHLKHCLAESEAICQRLKKQVADLEIENTRLIEKVSFLQEECTSLTDSLGQQLDLTNELEHKNSREVIKEIHHWHNESPREIVMEMIPELLPDVTEMKPLEMPKLNIRQAKRRNSSSAVVRKAAALTHKPSVQRAHSNAAIQRRPLQRTPNSKLATHTIPRPVPVRPQTRPAPLRRDISRFSPMLKKNSPRVQLTNPR